MKRVTKIADIELENSLFIQESLQTRNVKSVSSPTISGGVIVSEHIIRANAQNLTLVSLDSGWVSKTVVEAIRNLSDDLGVDTTIVVDGEEIGVRFRHEVSNGALEFIELYEGSSYCKGTLYLAKI